MSFTFTFSGCLGKTKVSSNRSLQSMNRWQRTIGEAMCWTFLAPLVRARRTRSMHAFAVELHDRQRIDRLLNELVLRHSDLLS
jgi:hypothetical protein